MGNEFYEDRGVLFFRVCVKAIDHKTLTVLKRHQNSEKHMHFFLKPEVTIASDCYCVDPEMGATRSSRLALMLRLDFQIHRNLLRDFRT